MARRPVQIAILDDDPSVRKALLRLFETTPYEVTAFASAIDFLATLDAHAPECLVVDYQMPNMTGLDLQLHLNQNGIHIPVIIITAHDDPGIRDTCIKAGAFAYFAKPIRKTTLINAIDKIVGTAPLQPG
jgi:FixJ family two-component response regulator